MTLRWMPKALAQKTISKLGLLRLYHRGQQTAGRLKNFHPDARVEYAAKLYADLAAHASIEGASMVEIGTGWVPVLPLALYLLGAKQIISYDLNRHLQPELTMRCVPLLRDCLPEIVRRTGADPAPLRQRLALLEQAGSIGELFALAGITYHAPADASRTGLADGSVDVVYSNLVLEHVTPAALESISIEARRILKPTGVCWHNVDFSDHYAATRRGMSKINFLAYSQRFWGRYGQNDILWQNRWRGADYRALFKRLRFELLAEIQHPSDEIRDDLSAGLKLDPAFSRFDADELSILSTRFVLGTGRSGP